MIVDYCVELLTKGQSSVDPLQYDSYDRILFKLQSGVAVRKLNGIKTALLMMAIIKEAGNRKCDQETMFRLFDNFVNYIWRRFPEPTCMALVKYAVADFQITVKKLSESSTWSKISGMFKPVMLDNSQDPKEKAKFERFERNYSRLKRVGHISSALAVLVHNEFPSLCDKGL